MKRTLENVVAASKRYESWLGQHVDIVPEDLVLKHGHMAADAFPFLRATYYRWSELAADCCADLLGAPQVLAVGDLHVENFGSWRDREGRLVWGINDFDEADFLPYTSDLVRLATSALLAAELDGWSWSEKQICAAILQGYSDGLDLKGRPFVIDEDHRWFVPMMHRGLRDPVRFWRKMRDLPKIAEKDVPESARTALRELLPEPTLECEFKRRTAGLGSLGRPRIVALANWRGGLIAREAKAICPAATAWARGEARTKAEHIHEILARAVRCPDPFLEVKNDWIVRRLAPDCSKIELNSLSRVEEQNHQLYAMGFETANVHVGTTDAVDAVQRDLSSRPGKWLRSYATAMLEITLQDWKEWRSTRAAAKRVS